MSRLNPPPPRPPTHPAPPTLPLLLCRRCFVFIMAHVANSVTKEPFKILACECGLQIILNIETTTQCRDSLRIGRTWMGTVSLCGRNESTHQTMIPNFPHFCTQFLPFLSPSPGHICRPGTGRGSADNVVVHRWDGFSIKMGEQQQCSERGMHAATMKRGGGGGGGAAWIDRR